MLVGWRPFAIRFLLLLSFGHWPLTSKPLRVLGSIPGLRLLLWRRVPVDSECLGKTVAGLQTDVPGVAWGDGLRDGGSLSAMNG